MTATLIMFWKFDNGATLSEDFVFDGNFTTTTREIAAHLEIVDGGAAFWRGCYADMQREWLAEKAERQRLESVLDIALDRLSPLVREAVAG